MLDVLRRNTGSAVGDGESVPVIVVNAQACKLNVDRTVFWGELECIGHKVEEDSFGLFTVEHIRILIFIILQERYMDMFLECQKRKGIHPFFHTFGQIKTCQVESSLSILILTEIKYLIDKAQKDIHILVRYMHKLLFLFIKM